MFKRKANRLCTFFRGIGPVPVATESDDKPSFVTEPPKRVGDDCLLFAEGQLRRARLLKNWKGSTFLVDMGPVWFVPIIRLPEYTHEQRAKNQRMRDLLDEMPLRSNT